MGDFDLDFAQLRAVVAPDRIPLSGNEHRITRIAFDLFRLDNDKENLWQVQADDDGNEFLVRTYELPKEDALQAKSEWSVAEDGKKASLTVSYRGMPIHRLMAADYGACTPEDVGLLRDLVQAKLADDGFASRMLATLPEPKRAALAAAFPKLAIARTPAPPPPKAPAKPKIPIPTGKDPLEGIEPVDLKKEYGIDPKAKRNLPPRGTWAKHPQNADEGEPKNLPAYPDLVELDRNSADDMHRLAQLAYIHGVDWTESEQNIPRSQLAETLSKAANQGKTVVRVAPKGSEFGTFWFLGGKIA